MTTRFNKILQSKLADRTNDFGFITKHTFDKALCYHRFSKFMRYAILNDLIDSGMLEVVSEDRFTKIGKYTKHLVMKVNGGKILENKGKTRNTKSKNYIKTIKI